MPKQAVRREAAPAVAARRTLHVKPGGVGLMRKPMKTRARRAMPRGTRRAAR